MHTVFIWMSCGTQFSLVTYMDNTKPKEGSYPTYTCTMNHWSQIKQQLLQHTGKNSRESRFTWYFSYEFHVKSSLRYKYVRYGWQQYFMWISCEITWIFLLLFASWENFHGNFTCGGFAYDMNVLKVRVEIDIMQTY